MGYALRLDLDFFDKEQLMNMKITAVASVLTALVLSGLPGSARAHCQVPCGIFDDHNRVHQMMEDLTTIKKAMTEIKALSSKKDAQSQNQLVRWVMTKEEHATRIMRTIADYFMAQKIKPASDKDQASYLALLARHHAVMVLAMKCKQTVDPKDAEALGKALAAIEKDWPAPKTP